MSASSSKISGVSSFQPDPGAFSRSAGQQVSRSPISTSVDFGVLLYRWRTWAAGRQGGRSQTRHHNGRRYRTNTEQSSIVSSDVPTGLLYKKVQVQHGVVPDTFCSVDWRTTPKVTCFFLRGQMNGLLVLVLVRAFRYVLCN